MNWATAGLEGAAAALRSGAATLERVVVSVRDVRLRSRLAKLDGFAFEYDYTTSHDAVWRDCLRPFAAQPDVHRDTQRVYRSWRLTTTLPLRKI